MYNVVDLPDNTEAGLSTRSMSTETKLELAV